MDISAWLRGVGLERYEQAFHENDIDLALLSSLTAENLKDLGVASVGHRKKLLAAIAELSRGVLPDFAREEAIPEVEGERRQVTVLFADLSGYTRLTAELDAEELHHLMTDFFKAVDAIIKDHGGTVDKHIGDCVMAIFGAPVAHGNDPERAVRAALAIHDGAMPALSEAVRRTLQVHIGIASGQVVAVREGGPGQAFAVTGQSVNLASRLTDAAGAGETLISKAVYESVAAWMLSDEVGELTVEGFAGAVRVWRLVGLRQQGAESARRTFVGRLAELTQFRGVLAACRETGTGLTVYLRGEAGIGKSRLAEEFRRLATDQGAVCHTALVLDFGVGEGRDAIRAIVRSLLGVSPDADPDVRRAAAVSALEEGHVEADRKVFLNDLLDLDQPVELNAVFDAMDSATRTRGRRQTVAQLVRRAAHRRPLVLTVEDLHWADPITLAYLAELTVAVSDCPAILVMTSRIDGDPIDEAWRGATRGSPLLTIDLGPMRRQEALALAGASIKAMPRLAMACIERAEGNPLFLEQLLHSAEETAAAHLPGSIQSIVLARVDNLDPLDRRALQAAAVIGQRFSLGILRHLLKTTDYTCDGLIKHYLIRPDGDDLLFAHALVWECVYASLLEARKRELHQQAAQYFAHRDPALHAEHLDRAKDPAAARAYLQAGRLQAAAYRPNRALQYVERGLALATEREDIWALTCEQGAIFHDLGLISRSIDAYRSALDVAPGGPERCEALLGMAAGMRVTDDLKAAFEVLEEAEGIACRCRLVSELARIHHLRGSLYFPLGNIDGCLEQHKLALRYAQELGSAELEARALSGLADASSMSARIKTAHDYFDRCIELARAHGLGRIEVANRHMRGIMRYYQNDLAGAVDDTLQGAEAAAKVGHQRAEMVARAASGYVLPDLGELDRARDQCEQALELSRRLGARRFEASSLRHLGRVLGAQGRRAEAVALLEEAYSISCEAGVTFSGPWALGALALYSDDPARRQWTLEEAEEILSRGCVFHNYFWFYRDGMEVSLQTGDWERAERYATALETFTKREACPWTIFFIMRARALAAWGRGRQEEAVLRELKSLRDEAELAGFTTARCALDTAIGAAGCGYRPARGAPP